MSPLSRATVPIENKLASQRKTLSLQPFDFGSVITFSCPSPTKSDMDSRLLKERKL